MSSPHLDNLVRIGQLKAETATQAEIDGLMRSGAARIQDAENERLSIESPFDLAYNAAHAFSLARNLVEYEGSAEVDVGLLTAMIRIARDVEAAVRALGPLP